MQAHKQGRKTQARQEKFFFHYLKVGPKTQHFTEFTPGFRCNAMHRRLFVKEEVLEGQGGGASCIYAQKQVNNNNELTLIQLQIVVIGTLGMHRGKKKTYAGSYRTDQAVFSMKW